MLSKAADENIISKTEDYFIPGGIKLHVEILYKDQNKRRKALFIHGGGITGNHTIARRPAMWLISKGVFEEVILPDRRGAGESSPFTKPMAAAELAGDMKHLLDEMGISEPLTVLAFSYGGPISLALASMDKRIEKVILLASSPMLTLTKGILKIPHKLGLLLPAIKFIIWSFTGRSGFKGFVDLDFVYDITSLPGYIKAQINILREMKRSGLKSMLLQAESVFLRENMNLPEDIKVTVPVIQVIGSKDRVWERNIPVRYLKNMPMFHQVIIEGATHKDIFLRADEFLSGATADADSAD